MADVAPACPVCSTGSSAAPDTPLRPREKPMRFRALVDVRVGSASTGAGDARVVTHDVRTEASLRVAASEDLSFTVTLPTLLRSIDSLGSERNAVSLGDVDARVAYSRSRGEGLVLTLGVKTPTAPIEHDALHRVLSSELQPGCSALTPYLGAMGAKSMGRWILRYGGSIVLPVSVREAPHPGDSIRGSTSAQYTLLKSLSVRAGVMTRFDLSGELRNGVDDPNSGGLVGYVTAGVSLSPSRSLNASFDVYLPALQILRGDHRESTVLALGLGYAF